MQKIRTFLWFDNQAEEAVALYTAIFKNARITDVTHYAEGGMGTPGTVMTLDFELEGQAFVALNGGPHYQFTPAISLSVGCETQGEVDALWDALTDGGEPMPCGWVTDKFGVTWQIVPNRLFELLESGDADKVRRVTEAMMKMQKMDIATLEQA